MKNPPPIKQSATRTKFDSGMQRDGRDGKIRWWKVTLGPMLRRWAILLTRGDLKYGECNWTKANGKEELEHFKDAAFRHFMQWFYDEVDEDHAAATIWNINGAEMVKERMHHTENVFVEKLMEGPVI